MEKIALSEEVFKLIFDLCEWISPKALTNIEYNDKLSTAIINIAIDNFKLYDDFTQDDLIKCIDKYHIRIALELTILYN